ncbi:molybdopterin-dependent oxidoreductase [Kineosporiaceae bacterium B12]|nr:molybdopterin-dependent oxidoreductase [Kineococcus rubinsiae]
MVLDVAVDPATGRRRVAGVTGDRSHPTNAGRLCTKGATSAEVLTAPGRATTALVREERGAAPTPVAVDDAVERVARRFRELAAEHGPDAVAVYVSGQMSLEAQYLATKLTKGFLGTHQLESNSRLCMASAGTGYKQSLGSDAPPGSYDDFDAADVFLVSGANMADCHPILFLRMMDRVRAGAKLIVVDPRRTATAEAADLFLQVRPGTDLALLNGLLHLLAAGGHLDEEFIASSTQGWEHLPALLAEYPPDVVAGITGLAEADLRRAAELIGGAENWMSCWTMGLNQSTHGVWNTNALVNLHLATGAICRRGSGPFSLTGQPNAMGGRDMGYMGPGLPGQRVVTDAADRAFTEELWDLAPGMLRTDVSSGTVDLFSRMASGEVKACWIICTNPVASVPNRSTVVAGLEACEFVVVQDAFADTETTAYADVLLPAALWAESEQVSINSERTLTLLQQAADPVGDALADWELIARVARAMGFGEHFAHASAAEVFDELRAFANPRTGYDLRGVDHERLRRGPVQWPAPPDDGADRHPVRYLNDGVSRDLLVHPDGTVPALAFATPSGRAVFHARPHLPPAEMPDDDFPFVLNTGRLPHQWHTLTKTGKVAKLNRLNPGPFVEVHPDDAARLAIGEGDRVEVASRRGRAVLPARVSDRVAPGSCFAPFHWSDLFGEDLAVNAVTNDAVDPVSFQPELKVCAVTLTRVAAAVPAPRTPSADVLVATGPPALDAAQTRYLGGFLHALEQRPHGVPVLPASAPFDADARAWLDGYLAGLTSRVPDAPAAAAPDVLVAWASQTGTAEEHAAAVAATLQEAGIGVDLVAMDALEPARVAAAGTVLAVTSTFGDGGAPDNGEAFWSALAADGAPRLPGTRFAVLALGDSSYSEFCGHGRRLDGRLAELGGSRLLERVDCEPGEEDKVEQWGERVLALLAAAPASSREAAPSPGTTTPVVPAQARRPPAFGRANPYASQVVRNVRLNAPGSSKEVRQVGFARTAEFAHAAGDSLGVWPVNDPAAVAEFLQLTGIDPEQATTLPDGATADWRTAATHHLELLRPSAEFLRLVAARTRDDELSRVLAGTPADVAAWTWGRQTLDVLHRYPARAEPAEWRNALKPLQPRQYSISSAPEAHPDEVQLTVSTVRFGAPERRRHGVCSAFLADRADGTDVRVFLQPSPSFRPPADPDAPLVMIGPGTGVAPFRAFLQHRRAHGHRGPNWLFFGERSSQTDWYYRDEFEAHREDGLLTRLSLAFSRDQPQKVYVQDRMRQHGAQLWEWIADGACVYVCGDASRMARDVDAALREVVATHGGLSADDAAEHVRELARAKRYVRDVY